MRVLVTVLPASAGLVESEGPIQAQRGNSLCVPRSALPRDTGFVHADVPLRWHSDKNKPPTGCLAVQTYGGSGG